MNIPFVLVGLLLLGIGIAELWIAASLPRLLPALRARAAAARPAPKGAASGPTAFGLLEPDPRALTVARVALAASALATITFAWGFATSG